MKVGDAATACISQARKGVSTMKEKVNKTHRNKKDSETGLPLFYLSSQKAVCFAMNK